MEFPTNCVIVMGNSWWLFINIQQLSNLSRKWYEMIGLQLLRWFKFVLVSLLEVEMSVCLFLNDVIIIVLMGNLHTVL